MTFTLTEGEVLLRKGKVTQTEFQHSDKGTTSYHLWDTDTEQDATRSDLGYTAGLTEASHTFTAAVSASSCTGAD